MEPTANRIEQLRESRDESLASLAVLCGVSEMTVRRWEKGESPISDQQKFKLAERFEVSPAYLMGWSDDRETVSSVGEAKV